MQTNLHIKSIKNVFNSLSIIQSDSVVLIIIPPLIMLIGRRLNLAAFLIIKNSRNDLMDTDMRARKGERETLYVLLCLFESN